MSAPVATSWKPTRKWWAATITAAGAVALAVVTGDGIDTDGEWSLVIGLIVQRAVAYVVPNEPTPSGVSR